MALMDWGMVCSVPNDEQLSTLKYDAVTKLLIFREFGKWFTRNVEKYGRGINQLYNFNVEPSYVERLTSSDGNGDASDAIVTTYENLCKEHPHVAFVLHILPHENSPEFLKLKELTCRLSLIGQGILLSNALSRFGNANEEAVFLNVNQYIARRFAQIVEVKSKPKGAPGLIVQRRVVPSIVPQSAGHEDLHGSVCTALHKDKLLRMAQIEHDGKPFRNSALVYGIPEQYNTFQVAAIFENWPIASVLSTSRGCAFVDFVKSNDVYKAKTYFNNAPFIDRQGFQVKISIIPMQSRNVRVTEAKERHRDKQQIQNRLLNVSNAVQSVKISN